MNKTLVYCYDAYCGWCYGFSSIIQQIELDFITDLPIEVLSGGMIISDTPAPISASAGYILQAYPTVEDYTGVTFGKDYLWHIQHPELSDWFPNSEKPAIALCVFKDYYPKLQVAFATDLQYALHYEGRDLCDDAAYSHLLEKYRIDATAFYEKLHNPEYKQLAYDEFNVCQQLKVTGFPTLFLQTSDTQFHLIARGYTDYHSVHQRITNILYPNDAL